MQVVTLWDLPTAQLSAEFKGHADSVRALAVASGVVGEGEGQGFSLAKNSLLASGGYDGAAKLWDIRQSVSETSAIISLSFSLPRVQRPRAQELFGGWVWCSEKRRVFLRATPWKVSSFCRRETAQHRRSCSWLPVPRCVSALFCFWKRKGSLKSRPI